MSRLNGKFSCAELGATLTISDAFDGNGSGKGVFTMGGMTIPVQLHYHFENSVGKRTNYRLWGSNEDPNQYVGMAGASETPFATNGISMAGGLSILGQTTGFSCFFKRA